jgi:nucleotide-binding universal stress UspA family protein
MPAEGIIAAAEEIGADLIVMASHGRRGLKRFILGSQANAVVTHSHVPILICR